MGNTWAEHQTQYPPEIYGSRGSLWSARDAYGDRTRNSRIFSDLSNVCIETEILAALEQILQGDILVCPCIHRIQEAGGRQASLWRPSGASKARL